MEKRIRTCALLGVLACAACTTHIDDMEFVGLERATPSMAHSSDYTWIASDGSSKPIEISHDAAISTDSLRVRFRSSINLVEHESGGDYLTISLCPYRDEPFVSVSEVFSGGHLLGDLRWQPRQIVSKEWRSGVYAGMSRYDGPSGLTPSAGHYYYEGFFEYKSLWHFEETLHTNVKTPLPQPIQDLCFKVVGMNMFWPDYKSNEVRIPAAVLSSVLASKGKSW